MSDRVLVRLANPELDRLLAAAFARYPRRGSGLLVRFGWRQTASDLVLTLANIEAPGDGDLDISRPNVAFTEQFLVRTALLAERDPLAVGVVHSHPAGHVPRPSHIDDDMDSYLSSYFEGFAPARPYVSLIASRVEDRTLMSDRVKVDGRWLDASRFLTVERSITNWRYAFAGKSTLPTERVARLAASVAIAGVGFSSLRLFAAVQIPGLPSINPHR